MSATAAAQTLPHRPDTERPAMTAQTTVHTPARINPDTLPVLITAIVVGLLVSGGASFTLSFDGLSAVAPWATVRLERAWLIPVSIDAAQIGFTLAAFIHLARGESARWAWTWVTLWTLVSASANAAHAWSSGPGGWEGIAGAGLAAFFPIGTLVTSHTAARIMIGRLSSVAASAAGPDGRTDVDTTTDGRADSGRTDTTPDPLVVLEKIETAPWADTASGARTGIGAGQPDGRADSGRTDTGQDTSAVRVEQLALEPVPDAARTDGHVYDQSTDTAADTRKDSAPDTSAGQTDGHDGGQWTGADTGRTLFARERRASASVEAVRPQIEELARQGMSGREIAGHLGIGRTRACEIVRDLREAGALVA